MENLGHFSQLYNFIDLKPVRLLYFSPMQNTSNNAVLSALFAALRPIARLLMKAGIGYREFAEVSKCAFVDVSTSDFGLRGRPTNISRVAVMTGLTRKEVKRLRDKIDSGTQVETTKVIPLSEIIHQWHTDSDYVDARGKPKELSFDVGKHSFASLVKKYGGDIPPGAMRTELKRVKAIEEAKGGMLVVQRRHIRAVETEKIVEYALSTSLLGLSNTINHNVDKIEEHSWVERVASTSGIRDEDKTRVRRISRDRAEEFITSIDDLFSAYETIYPEEGQGTDTSVVGVGVYYFEVDDPNLELLGN